MSNDESYSFSFNRSSKQLHLIDLLGFLAGLRLLELYYLIYRRFLIEICTLFFFINSNFMEF